MAIIFNCQFIDRIFRFARENRGSNTYIPTYEEVVQFNRQL